jgi:hypothetical protein
MEFASDVIYFIACTVKYANGKYVTCKPRTCEFRNEHHNSGFEAMVVEGYIGYGSVLGKSLATQTVLSL